MADDRRVFVEIIVDDTDARARLGRVDSDLDRLGQSATRATAAFHALFDKTGQQTAATGASTSATMAYARAHEVAAQRFSETNRQLVAYTNYVRTIGRDAEQAGQALTMYLTLPILGIGTAAISSAATFETNMTKLVTLSGVTEKNMRLMREEVLKLAPAVGIGPLALSEGLLQVTSTGIRGAEAMQVLEQAAKMSAIGMGETKTVAEALTSAMAAYGNQGMTAAHAAAIFHKTVIEGKGELSSFAGSLGRIVSVAAQVGISLEDVGTFMATFTRTGGSAAEAVTALRNIILRLEIASKSTTENALAKLGTTLADLRKEIAEKGLTQAMVNLFNTFGMTNGILGELFPNVRGIAGAMSVFGVQSKSALEIWQKMGQNLDSLDTAFARRQQDIGQQWNQLKAQMQVAAIALGTQLIPLFKDLLPILDRGIKVVGWLAEKFGDLPVPLQYTAVGLAAVIAGAGPLLMLLGGFSRVLGVVIDMMILTKGGGLAGAARQSAGAIDTVYGSATRASATLGGTLATALGTTLKTMGAMAVVTASASAAIYALSLAFDVLAQKEQNKRDADRQADAELRVREQAARIAGVPKIWSAQEAYSIVAEENRRKQQAYLDAQAEAERLAKQTGGQEGKVGADQSAWDRLRDSMARYKAELNGLSAAQRTTLNQALREGVISQQELTKALGISSDALQWYAKQQQGAAMATKEAAKVAARDQVEEQRAITASIKLLETWEAKQHATMQKQIREDSAEGLASQNQRILATYASLTDMQQKVTQQGLTGTALRLAQIDEEERAWRAAAAEHSRVGSALYREQDRLATQYYQHLRDLANETAGTVQERLEASGVHTRQTFADMAAKAKITADAMERDGTAVWSSQQIAAARQLYLELNAAAAGKTYTDWRTRLGQTGQALSEMFQGVSGTFATIAKVGGEVAETLADATIDAAAKASVALAGLAQAAFAIGDKVLGTMLSGAAAGAGIGGWIGGIIGGVAGLITGLVGDSQDAQSKLAALRAEIEGVQADLVATYGSVKAVYEIAAVLGIQMREVWDTNQQSNLQVFTQRVDLFKEALSRLDQKLKDTATSMSLLTKAEIDQLRQLRDAGYNSEAMQSFTQTQFGRITSGAIGLVSGFASPWLQKMAEAEQFAEKTDAISTRILDLKAKIADMDAKGGPSTEQQARNYTKWKEEVVELNAELAQLIEKHKLSQAEIEEFTKNGQEAFDRYGRIIATAFAASILNGKTFLQALTDLETPLSQLQLLMEKFGFKASSTLATLLGWSKFAKDNKELVSAVSSLNEMLSGLWNTGMLTEEMFKDLGATAREMFDKMVKAGRSPEEAMRAMQPSLQTLWQIWKDTGWVIDEATLALLKHAEESGIVGEKFKDPARKQVEALETIQKTLGDLTQFFREDFVKAIVDAFAKAAKAAELLGKDIDEHLERTRRVPVEYEQREQGESGNPDRGAERFHAGGVVGMPWWVAHRGLAVDEVPIIAQRGERVLSRHDTSQFERAGGLQALRGGRMAGGRAGAAVVQVTVKAWDAASVQDWLDEGGGDMLAEAVQPRIPGLVTRLGLDRV